MQWLVLPLVFLAGFVDSIAGGGGLISLTSYLAVGLPAHQALGTNKFSSTFGTGVSTIQFMRKGHIDWPTGVIAALGALGGASIGARLALLIDERILSYIMIGVVPLVALFLLFNKSFGEDTGQRRTNAVVELTIALLIGLVMGTYDGFFGPGTGTFLIMAFTAILGLPLLTSMGNTKVVNFASNIGALTTFIIKGQVLYTLAIPAAACSILGNFLGTKLAMKKGIKVVRPMMLVVIALLLAKILWDLVVK